MFYATRAFPASPFEDELFGPSRRGRCHPRAMKGGPHHRRYGFGGPPHGRFHVVPPHHIRQTQMMETEKEVRLSLDLPGVKAKDIDLVLNEGILSLSATRQVVHEGLQKKHRVEKTFSVDRAGIDDSKPITANLFNGVLQIVLHKAEKKAPLRITITEDEPMEEAIEQEEKQEETVDEEMAPSEEADAKKSENPVESSVEAVAVTVETVKPDEEEDEIVVVDVQDAEK